MHRNNVESRKRKDITIGEIPSLKDFVQKGVRILNCLHTYFASIASLNFLRSRKLPPTDLEVHKELHLTQ